MTHKWLFGFCCAFALLIIIGIYYHDEDNVYGMMVSSYELCDVKAYAQLADSLEIPYTFDYSRYAIGIKLSSNNNNRLAEFSALYDNYNDDKYSNHQQEEYAVSYYIETTEPTPVCHLNDVKHHVENINPNLLPHIPNDADHVSYHSSQDKAVYCYYLQGDKGGSQCFYISLYKEILTKDDISDIERANLEIMVKRYPHILIFKNKRPDEFKAVHSAVIDWTDRPPNLLYGIELSTFYEYRDLSIAIEKF